MGKSESRQFCNENIKDGKGSERVGVGRKLAGDEPISTWAIFGQMRFYNLKTLTWKGF